MSSTSSNSPTMGMSLRGMSANCSDSALAESSDSTGVISRMSSDSYSVPDVSGGVISRISSESWSDMRGGVMDFPFLPVSCQLMLNLVYLELDIAALDVPNACRVAERLEDVVLTGTVLLH